MNNVRLTWTLPTVTPVQLPIAHTEISVRVDSGLPWTVQDIVTPDVLQELLFADVGPGQFFYRAVVVDTGGNRGPEAFADVAVPFEGPGAVTGFTATLEVI